MNHPAPFRHRFIVVAVLGLAGAAGATIFNMTFTDFHLPGTQVLEVGTNVLHSSSNCQICHANYDEPNEPHATWAGSLMALGGRDPLFFAQMTTANQDVANVGYFCMRCHVPNSFVTGHAYQPDGTTLDEFDREGVSCHFCHSMVDPIFKPGVSPPEDQAILAALTDVPQFYGNAMFVLDPTGTRRGPRSDALPAHQVIPSPFHKTGEFCGTCHDVGNVATTKQPDGTFRYNALDTAPTSTDPHQMFPLERTYTEWKLSAFANGGVDMGGRFGGDGASVVSTCQDCHMPKVAAQACSFGPPRPDMARHTFAGAGAQVLDLIAEYTRDDPFVDQSAIARGRAAAVDMLQRAATLELTRYGPTMNVRVVNQTGHKLPTGHIEGRRVWVNVRFFNAAGSLVAEHGGYDHDTATLDTASTIVYEMHVGLSPGAAALTGLPAGPTGHMSLADTIEKDTRIPPRGFNNAAYEAGGAPSVGAVYADGQHWSDVPFAVPAGSTRAEVSLYYQNTPREYIEHLRDANVTDQWGNILYNSWADSGRGAPIRMAREVLSLLPKRRPAGTGESTKFVDQIALIVAEWGCTAGCAYDIDADGTVGLSDIAALLTGDTPRKAGEAQPGT